MNNERFNIKKLILFGGLVLLTGFLMFFFKNKGSISVLMEDTKNNLESYYTANLKPLFFKADINSEDLFNFALQQNIPIDKNKGDILQIGTNINGKQTFALRPAVWKGNTNNYNKFINYFKLKHNEIKQLDSILSSYRNDIYSSILVNEHTVAVNPGIIVLRQALGAEIYNFTKALSYKNEGKTAPYLKLMAENSKLKNYVNEFTADSSNKYIFFGADKVFNGECDFNKKELREKITEWKDNLSGLKKDLRDFKVNVDMLESKSISQNDSLRQLALTFNLDSNLLVSTVPGYIFNADIEELKNMEIVVDSIINSNGINSLKILTDTLENTISVTLDQSIEGDSMRVFTFDLNINCFDSLINKNVKYLDDRQLKDWNEFGIRVDSLAGSLQLYFNDSTGDFDTGRFMIDIKKFKEKLKSNISKSKDM